MALAAALCAASAGLIPNGYVDAAPPPVTTHVQRPHDSLGVLERGFGVVVWQQAVDRHVYLTNAAWLQEDDRLRRAAVAGYQPARAAIPDTLAVNEFIRGWREAGGVESWLDHVLTVVIPCESGWNRYAVNPAGPYTGLGQWHPATWSSIARITGLWDIYDPHHQGYNMAFKTRRDGGFEWECW